MQTPESVEDILGRLMPPALSPSFEQDLCDMFDELAPAITGAAPTSGGTHPPLRWLAGGIAAAGAAAALFLYDASRPGPRQAAAPVHVNEIVLVSESDRVESMTDEGLRELLDGSTMHAMRLSLVEESSLLDEETGIVMQVSEPREEVLLMPVSAF